MGVGRGGEGGWGAAATAIRLGVAAAAREQPEVEVLGGVRRHPPSRLTGDDAGSGGFLGICFLFVSFWNCKLVQPKIQS